MKFTNDDTSRLFEILHWRRDVRHFKSTPLPDDAVEKLKMAIAMAPSVGNSRPWRIISVESMKTREKIIENFLTSNEKASSLYKDQEKKGYLALKLAGLKEAPLQLAIFTDLDPQHGKGLGRQTMPETLAYSTVTAIHQLWLVARTMNIGVGWVSILEPETINEALDVNPAWKFTAYLCIGYPQTDEALPELHRVDWQTNEEPEWLTR